LEASDYFIMAIVFAIVLVGLAVFIGQPTSVFYPPPTTAADEQAATFYGVIRSLADTSLCLMIGFVVAGIVKTIVKRKRG
jgi:uncharacterized membrane protein